jgi:hypothetical protein
MSRINCDCNTITKPVEQSIHCRKSSMESDNSHNQICHIILNRRYIVVGLAL